MNYDDFRLVKFESMRLIMPLTLADFYERVNQEIKANSEHLKNVWLKECARIIESFYESIESLMPKSDDVSFAFLKIGFQEFQNFYLRMFVFIKWIISLARFRLSCLVYCVL